jgi:shikimate dehydrogenase
VSAVPVRLAVLGEPLTFTRSPELHRAGGRALGLEVVSDAFRTPPSELGGRLAELAARGYRGVNLTSPLKQAVLPYLQRVAEDARRARSVNTVGFDAAGWWGESTDGPGFVDLLRALGRAPERERVTLLGAGAAARSLALALAAAGCTALAVSTRRPGDVEEAWCGVAPVRFAACGSAQELAALARSTLVVNATPLTGAADPLPLERVPRGALLIDLVYGETLTPWIARARARGHEAHDGLGLLVHQARRSLSLWLGRGVPIEPLQEAVGWPR